MCHHSGSIVPGLVVRNERHSVIDIMVRATIDKQIPMVHITEMNIFLTQRTWLYGLIRNLTLNCKEINQNLPESIKIYLFLRKGMKDSNGKIIVPLLNSTSDHPAHQKSSLDDQSLSSLRKERCRVNKSERHGNLLIRG